MDFIAILLISVALSMDAFAVSICKGLAMNRPTPKQYVTIVLWFSLSHVIAISLGYCLGGAFHSYITEYDHWIAFILLLIIGLNMVRESFSDEEEGLDADTGYKIMLPLSVAISIDALAIGISLAMDSTGLFVPAAMVGITVAVISTIGMRIGSAIGGRYGSRAEFVGGVVLVLIGVKILLEHLGFI